MPDEPAGAQSGRHERGRIARGATSTRVIEVWPRVPTRRLLWHGADLQAGAVVMAFTAAAVVADVARVSQEKDNHGK